MITRLADRVEDGPNGKVKIKRYGLWGTNAEIEKRGKEKYVLVNWKESREFKHLEEAEIYLQELVSMRRR